MKEFYQNPSYDWWVECEYIDGFWYASIMPKNLSGNPEFELSPYKLGGDESLLTYEDYVKLIWNQGIEKVLVIPN